MKKYCLLVSLAFLSFHIWAQQQTAQKPAQNTAQKTAFQTSSPWIPQIDVRSDMAIVYGVNDRKGTTFEQRVRSWRDRGYTTAFMTGIAWGQYYDYFLGEWDGQNHLGIGQVTQKGDTIFHGKNMPYVVPVQSFIEYMKTAVVKRVIDAGISIIFRSSGPARVTALPSKKNGRSFMVSPGGLRTPRPRIPTCQAS